MGSLALLALCAAVLGACGAAAPAPAPGAAPLPAPLQPGDVQVTGRDSQAVGLAQALYFGGPSLQVVPNSTADTCAAACRAELLCVGERA